MRRAAHHQIELSSGLGAPSRRSRWSALGGALLVTSCASHPPAPLDPSAHLLTYLDRSVLAPSLVEQLEALAPRLSPTLVFDPSDGLTVDEAEVVALFFAPQLRAARAELAVAVADESTAGLWEDPVFGFDGAAIVDPRSGFDHGLEIGLTLPVSGRLRAELRQSRAELATELTRVAASEWRTRVEVRRLWVEWSTLEALHAVASEHERALAVLVANTALLTERGGLARTETRLLEAELARTRIDVLDARLAADEARQRIHVALGVPSGSGPELTVGVPDHTHARPTRAALALEERLASNADVAIARLAYAASEAALRTELRKQYPDLSIGAGIGSEDDDTRFPFSLSLPLPLWNANARGIARAVAERTAARVALETTIEEFAARSAAAERRLAALQSQAQLVADTLEPLIAAQSTDLAALAELGRVDVLVVLESQRFQYETAVTILESQRALQLAGIDIVELVGAEPFEPDRPLRVDSSSDEHLR